MADDVSSADERPSTPDDDQTRVNPVVRRSDKLPLLSFLGRNSNDKLGGAAGFVGVLIVGALALVIALVAVTIAIGRAPEGAAPSPQASPSESTTPSSQVTYQSPEPTGTRWTPQPIVTGVEQLPPSYEPTPTETPTPSEAETTKPPDETTAPPGQTVIGGGGGAVVDGDNNGNPPGHAGGNP